MALTTDPEPNHDGLDLDAVFVVGLYWAPVVLFIVLILVMILRPTGLMGGKE